MGSVNYGLRLEFPAGWIELPPPGSDMAAWARETVAPLHAATSPDHPFDPDALADNLAQVAADSASRAPILGAALWPGPGEPVAVLAEIVQLAPDPGVPFTVEQLARQLAVPHKSHTKPAEVTVVTDLEPGPAVRVRRAFRGERDKLLRRTVTEQVDYFILPTALADEGLLFTASWVDLALGDVHAKEADELVRRLGVEVAPG